MSRVILDRLCQQVLLKGARSCEAQQLHAYVIGSRRHKATSVTAPLRHRETEPALAEEWNSDVSGVSSSVSGVTSQNRAASSACPVHKAKSSTTAKNYSSSVAASNVEEVTSDEFPTATHAQQETVSQQARPFSEMPAARSFPVIGTMWMHFPGGPLHGLSFEQKTARMEEIYGPVFKEKVILNFTMVHAYKPEDIEAVYRVQGTRPRRDAFRMLKMYNDKFLSGVQGLLTSQGEEWHRLRSKAQVKMMKPKSASAYMDLHNAVSRDFVSRLDQARGQDGVIEDLLPLLYKFAMEGIGCVCFNRRLGALEENIPLDSDTYRFIEAVSDVMEVSHAEISSIFLNTRSKSFKKLIKAQSFIRHLSMQEAKRSLEMFTQTQKEVMDGESGDLIPYLMSKTDLKEAEVMTLVSEFFFAGVDTTSHFLGFALYCLGKAPEVQEKLVEEIDRLVAGSDDITSNTLGRMSYLKAVTKETFRMTPITPGNGRTLDTDVVLSGYTVPKGLMIGLHHDHAGKSEKYVKDAHVFMPERWLRGNDSPHADIHPFILMPFGFGPRSCIGRRFAEQEFSLALIKILQKYHVEYAYDKDLLYEMCIVNKPLTPLKFRFVPRK